MRIEVGPKVEHRKGVSKDGEPFEFFHQEAWAHFEGERYPLPFSLKIDDAASKYEPGQYRFSMSSFQVERGRLGFSYNPELIPLEGQRAKAAA